jgi:hypothetical protein
VGFRAVFEGRPSGGLAILLVYGSMASAFGTMMVCLLLRFGEFDLGMLVGIIIVFSFSAFFFRPAIRGLRLKRLVIDDRGISYFAGRKLEWEALWVDIVGLRTSSTASMRASFEGITIVSIAGDRELSTAETFGSKRLRAAFREMARRASGQNIRMADGNGWATDLKLQFAPWEGDAPVRSGDYIGKWHYSNDPFIKLKVYGYLAGICLVVGLVAFALSGPAAFYYGLVLIAALLAGYATLSYLTEEFSYLWFDSAGVVLKLNSGREIQRAWDQVKIFRYDGHDIAIRFEGGIMIYFGYFPADVGDAMRQVYSQRRAEMRGQDG